MRVQDGAENAGTAIDLLDKVAASIVVMMLAYYWQLRNVTVRLIAVVDHASSSCLA